METIKRGRGRPAGKKVSMQVRPEEVIQQQEEPVVETKVVTKVNRSGRPKRTPINGYRDILKVEGQEPGYHYAWITGDNSFRFENAGYEFVEHDVVVGDKRVNAASQVGSKVSIPGGNGVTLYLMRVPEDIYQEEMELLNNQIDSTEEQMKKNLNSKENGQYGSVTIGRGKVNY